MHPAATFGPAVLGAMHVNSSHGLAATQAAVVLACTDLEAALSLESVPADKPLHKFSGLLVCSTAYARFRVTFCQGPASIIVEINRDSGSRYAVLQLFGRVKQRIEAWPDASPFAFAPSMLAWSAPALVSSDLAEDGDTVATPASAETAGAADTIHTYYLTGITSQYEDVACESLAAFAAHVASVTAAEDVSPASAAAVYWPEAFAALAERLADISCSRVSGALAAAALGGLLQLHGRSWAGKPALTLNPNLATVVAIAVHRACINGHPISTGPQWERRILQRYLVQVWGQVVDAAAAGLASLRTEVLALVPGVQRAIRQLCTYTGPYKPLQDAVAAVLTIHAALQEGPSGAPGPPGAPGPADASGPPREKVMCSRIIHKRTDSRERFTANERYLRIVRHSHPSVTGPPWPRPLSSPFPCDNCHRRFLGAPVFLVIKMLDGTLQEDGNFCSGPCANRYLDTFMRDGFLAERKANLLEYMQTVHGFKGSQLGMAPLWVEHQRYGGVLTDEAFDAIIGNPELTTTILQHPFIPTESVVEWKYVRDGSRRTCETHEGAPASAPPSAPAPAPAPAATTPLSAPALDAVMGPPTLDIQRHQHWDVTDLQQPPLEEIQRRLRNLPPLPTFKSQWSVFLEQTAALGTTGVVPTVPAKKRARVAKPGTKANDDAEAEGVGGGSSGGPGGGSSATVEAPPPKPPSALTGLLTTRRTKKVVKP
jgi:hypothetical protein